MIRCVKTLAAGAAAVGVLCALAGCGDEKYVPKQEASPYKGNAESGKPLMSPPPPGVVPGVNDKGGSGTAPAPGK